MKPYRGRVIIECTKDPCVKGKRLIDAECVKCEYAQTHIVDLAEKNKAKFIPAYKSESKPANPDRQVPKKVNKD